MEEGYSFGQLQRAGNTHVPITDKPHKIVSLCLNKNFQGILRCPICSLAAEVDIYKFLSFSQLDIIL